MRLSVKVARKFFDLQDVLDFDKASKTIEWLLINSQAAIEKLAAQSQKLPNWSNQHISSTGSHEKSMSSSASMSEVVSETNKDMESAAAKPKRKRKLCKVAVPVNPLARESRDKARARARERTIEKVMIQRSSLNSQSTDQLTLKNSKNDSGFTHAIGDHKDATRIEPTPGCYAMTSKKPSLGNAKMQKMNPNLQEHNTKLPSTSNPSSIFMTISNHGHWNNPSSFFVPAPNTQDHQQNPNPNPFFMSTAPSALEGIINPVFSPINSSIGYESYHFLGNQFQ